MRAEAGVLSLLAGAARNDNGYIYTVVDGDLCQMAAQKDFLVSRGFHLGMRGVYAAVRTEEDQIRAFRAIWEAKVEGWWNLERKFIAHSICTQEEFNKALGRI